MQPEQGYCLWCPSRESCTPGPGALMNQASFPCPDAQGFGARGLDDALGGSCPSLTVAEVECQSKFTVLLNFVRTNQDNLCEHGTQSALGTFMAACDQTNVRFHSSATSGGTTTASGLHAITALADRPGLMHCACQPLDITTADLPARFVVAGLSNIRHATFQNLDGLCEQSASHRARTWIQVPFGGSVTTLIAPTISVNTLPILDSLSISPAAVGEFFLFDAHANDDCAGEDGLLVSGATGSLQSINGCYLWDESMLANGRGSYRSVDGAHMIYRLCRATFGGWLVDTARESGVRAWLPLRVPDFLSNVVVVYVGRLRRQSRDGKDIRIGAFACHRPS